MSEERLSLREEVEQLKEALNKGKAKRFGSWRLALRRNKIKKGYYLVLYIRNNMNVDIYKVKQEEMVVIIDRIIHEATPNATLMFRGRKPMLILTEWNEKPFIASENYKKAADDNTLTTGQQYILNAMEKGTILNKKKISVMTIFIIIIVLIGGYYFFGRGNPFG